MKAPLHLFQGYGVELEYMIVDRATLEVSPCADRILLSPAGEPELELPRGDFAWSNELALHVLEMKTATPAPALGGLAAGFQREIVAANRLLADIGACLLPTAMHPWMDPERQSRLWPHEQGPIYRSYDRIFDCRGHGWTNLQSVHLNLPFAGDDEFGRLHAAIRAVLPLLPALAASSPFVEGEGRGLLDSRLGFYCRNQQRIPEIIGAVIPERVWTRRSYRERVLRPMYRAIAPHDPERLLQEEWLNSRGAIARFERSAIEIRLLDIQECPLADLAILRLVGAAVQALAEERWVEQRLLRRLDERVLGELLQRSIRDGEQVKVDLPELLAVFGRGGVMAADEFWASLAEELLDAEARREFAPALATLFGEGPLASRIVRACGPDPVRERLREVYGALADCLARGELFHAS